MTSLVSEDDAMNRRRTIALALVLVAGPVWAAACGDGATEPPAPTPDPPRATTLTVTPATLQFVALGATEQLTAEVRDQNGNAMAGAAVSWASGAGGVAAVNASGLVTAAGNGTATITATSGSASGSAAVTVEQEVSAVTVTPVADMLVVGDTLRLTAEAADANGHAVAGADVAWASQDTLVAVVDSAGLVTGVAAGETEVSATAAGVTGRAVLTVVAPAPTAITVAPDTVALTALGQTAQLAAEVQDQIGRVMEGVRVSWSSADTTVAAVDSAGLVTAVGGGSAAIKASAGEASGEALVTVMQSAGSVVVYPAADTVALGDTLRLVAEAFDANGNAIAGAEFGWSSSDTSVATVDGSGLVRGVAEGAATITAAAGDDASGTSEIAVHNPDRGALVALYEATGGPNWVDDENWLTDAPLGEWYGVYTDASGRVVQLHLYDNDLIGPMPPELGNLSNLTWLKLISNALSGSIPAELGNLANLVSLDLGINELTGPIPPALGNLDNLESLDLWNNDLEGPIPAELGSLASLTQLSLGANTLTGPIPAELGNLANLESLSLWNNELTGVIPQGFLQLRGLTRFDFGDNDGLCAPGTVAFASWLEGVSTSEGPFCNQADREALERLYETAGASGWTRSDGWLATPVLGEWHGVVADSLGRPTTLDLTGNGLTGRLPATLGNLTELTRLRIGSNALSGPLPLALTGLALVEFVYAGTELCAPADSTFQGWLSRIPSHQGAGVAECAPLSEREILEVLYEATGGPGWRNSENWLTDVPMGEWLGVEVDDRGRVVELHMPQLNGLRGRIPPELGGLAELRVLYIGNNDLEGPIPAQLGDLTNLRELALWWNDLEGRVPPQLGNLANLEWLALFGNDLEGPIPPEFGNLANLGDLSLAWNDLEGPIPPELGNLANLKQLRLQANDLEGPIPPDLSNLANLEWLFLQKNDLEGPIPPELGNLVNLTELDLEDNALSGPLPPELGNLVRLELLYLSRNDFAGPLPAKYGDLERLRELGLQGNRALSGALPASLTRLQNLESLNAGGTALCAPSDPGFLEWLERVSSLRVAPCRQDQPPRAYLVQAVQSREFPVPLVADREALLRVFVTARRDNDAGLPPVRASFYLGGALAHVADLPGKRGPVPTEVVEGSLTATSNAVIPSELVRPGLEMVVEVDPDGTLDPALGVATRMPETGRLALDVRETPVLDLTLVPLLLTAAPDSAILSAVQGMADDPAGDMLLWHTRKLLPAAGIEARAHEPVLSSSDDPLELLKQVRAIRAVEGGAGNYMGLMSGLDRNQGLAGVGGWSSFSVPDSRIVAHELGHNLSLLHTPGVSTIPDRNYPHPNETIGVWGYDFDGGGKLVPPAWYDLMSYAHPGWISDYHFSKAFRYWKAHGDAARAPTAAVVESLLLWGGVDAAGTPHLDPAFVVNAPPALPQTGGNYRIVGMDAGGRELFSLRFDMPETADGDGSSSFAFVLPVRAEWEGNLASINLTGPAGSVMLDADSDIPMAILRNPRTGQIRGILKDPAPATQAAADAIGQGVGTRLEVLFSRGIPDAEAWRR